MIAIIRGIVLRISVLSSFPVTHYLGCKGRKDFDAKGPAALLTVGFHAW